MPYDEGTDDGIKHGNLRQFLAYNVGPHELKGWWIVTAVAVLGFVVGMVV